MTARVRSSFDTFTDGDEVISLAANVGRLEMYSITMPSFCYDFLVCEEICICVRKSSIGNRCYGMENYSSLIVFCSS